MVIFTDMAEARQIEEMRSLLAAIVEYTEDAVISKRLDQDSTITSWNRGAEEMYGYSAEEAVGRSISLIFPPERLPDELSEMLEKLKKGVSISHYETVRLRKDGNRIDVGLTISPLRDTTGRIFGAAIIERDITMQKRMNAKLEQYRFHLEEMVKARTEELRASQKQMAEAQKLAHAGSFEWDIAKDTVSLSEGLLRIVGVEAQEPDQSLERNIVRFLHPDDQDYLRDLFEKACRDKEPFEYQHRIIRPDGSVRILKGSAEVFIDIMDNPLRIIGFVQDVTELKQAEDALRESEEKYRLIVENAQEGIWVIDAGARTVFANSRLAGMLGYTVDEMLGKPIYAFMAEQHAALAQHYFERCRQGIGERIEFEFLHQDGSTVYTSMATAPHFDGSGRFIGAQAMVTDITKQKQTEEMLHESEERMRLAQEVAHIGTFEWNIRTGVNTWTPALETLYGLPPGGFTKTQPAWVNLIHPDDRAEAVRRVEQSFETGRPAEGEWRVVWPDGSIHWLAGRWQVFKDESGRPLRMTGINIDITERKQAEEEIRFLAKLPTENPNPIVRVARGGKILYANSASSPLLTEWSRAKGEYLPDTYYQVVRESFDSRQNREMELICQDHVFSFFIAPVIEADYANLYGRDITGYKRAEKEKAKIQAQLLQSQKMEAIGILAGGVAHDFNNLLTTIKGYTTLALMHLPDSDPASKDLYQIKKSADRAANLTRQLLLFSRKQLMEPTLFNLNSLIANLLKMLYRLIGEDMAIVTDLESHLWPIMADEGTIEQAIMNLAVNARDAMPTGGRLTIKTENVILDEEQAKTIPEARAGRFVCLAMADTGKGMDAETMEHLFEPFFTTKGVGKGTGLGLSVVYGIVKQHGGWN